MSLKSLADTGQQKTSPLFEAYKSYFSAFYKYLEITQIYTGQQKTTPLFETYKSYFSAFHEYLEITQIS